MKTALLVIDVQNALCTGAGACFDIDRVVDRINLVSAKARKARAPVIFVQHEAERVAFRYGSEGWQLYSRLVVLPDDLRTRKTSPDSFHKTDLQSVLQAHDIDRLIICGLQSDFCVDATTRGALALGYPVMLVKDAHSTTDNDVLTAAQISAHHTTTLANTTSFGPRVTPIAAADLRIEA